MEVLKKFYFIMLKYNFGIKDKSSYSSCTNESNIAKD